LVTLKFIAGRRVCCPSLIWATNLSPISCWKRTKRLGYRLSQFDLFTKVSQVSILLKIGPLGLLHTESKNLFVVL
jgi:hypothetical protein